MPPMEKNKGIFVGKNISMSYLASPDRLISVTRVLKSSPYLHFWTLRKSVTKISGFGYMKESTCLKQFMVLPSLLTDSSSQQKNSFLNLLDHDIFPCQKTSSFTDHCLSSAVKSRFLACLPRFLGFSEEQNHLSNGSFAIQPMTI